MAQEIKINVTLGDDELTNRLNEQLRLAEQLKRTLSETTTGGAPAPTPAASPAAPSSDEGGGAGGGGANGGGGAGRRGGGGFSAGVASFATQTTAGGLLGSVGTMLTRLPAPLSYLTGPVGAYLGVKGASLEAREAQAGQIAGLEQLEAQLAGAVDIPYITPRDTGEGFTDQLTALGYGATEARGLALSSATAYGRRVTESELSDALRELGAAQRAGIPAALLTSLAGAMTESQGVEFPEALALAREMRNLAEQGLDLRGAGVQQFLGGVAAYTQQLTSQGISTEGNNLAASIRGVSQATGRRGQRALEITQGLGGIAQGARASIASPFAGLAQAAVLAQAYETAAGPLEAMAEAERITATPALVQAAVKSAFGGGDVAALALASGAPIGTREARDLAAARTLQVGGAEGARLTAAKIEAGLEVSAGMAGQATQTTRQVRAEEATLKTLIEVSGQLQRNVINLTNNNTALTNLADKTAKALDLITRYLP